MVTPALFESYPYCRTHGRSPLEELEDLVKTTGFYRNKAKSLKEASQRIVSEFSGEVPQNMDDLLSLRGAARKTANVVLGNAFNINAGVVVDTHVKRFSYRFGLTREKNNTNKIERDLMALFPSRKLDRFIPFNDSSWSEAHAKPVSQKHLMMICVDITHVTAPAKND